MARSCQMGSCHEATSELGQPFSNRGEAVWPGAEPRKAAFAAREAWTSAENARPVQF